MISALSEGGLRTERSKQEDSDSRKVEQRGSAYKKEVLPKTELKREETLSRLGT